MKKIKFLSSLLTIVLAMVLVSGCSGNPKVSEGSTSNESEAPSGKPATPQVVRISTGPLGAYQHVLYSGIADMVNSELPGYYNFAIENSTGSVENANKILLGEVDFGTAGADVTLNSYNATEEFEGMTPKKIAHVANHGGTGAATHIMVLENSPINSISDLKGKNVGVGSGVMTKYFLQAIEPYGLVEEDMKLTKLSLADLTNGLADGTLDAISYSTAFPASNLTDLAITKGFKLLDIGVEKVNEIMNKYPYMHSVTIPAGTYPGVDYAITTFAQYTMLCASIDTPDEVVYNLVKIMMENNEKLGDIHPNASLITLESSVEGAMIPLHPGAEKYYKEVGRIK